MTNKRHTNKFITWGGKYFPFFQRGKIYFPQSKEKAYLCTRK